MSKLKPFFFFFFLTSRASGFLGTSFGLSCLLHGHCQELEALRLLPYLQADRLACHIQDVASDPALHHSELSHSLGFVFALVSPPPQAVWGDA